MLARLIAAPFWWVLRFTREDYWKARGRKRLRAKARKSRLRKAIEEAERAKWDRRVFQDRVWDRDKQIEQLKRRVEYLERYSTELAIELETRRHGVPVMMQRSLSTSGPGVWMASGGPYTPEFEDMETIKRYREEIEALGVIERNYVG